MEKSGEVTDKTIGAILEGIRKIKGENILIIDLNTIHYTECGYFIICQGNSNTQVSSIANSVEETVKVETGMNAWHSEGYKNAIWVLIDYGDVVVHVFQKEARNFYNLEGLWADAKITKVDSEN
jgi:ribosome-associated protein